MKFVRFFIIVYIFVLYNFIVYDYDCSDKLKVNRIQIPLNDNDYYDWGSSNVIDKIGWKLMRCESKLSSKTILNDNDTLPPSVMVPKLTNDMSDELYYITTTLFNHLNDRGILFFPVFGSLLASFRNDIAILPWDDDLDITIDGDDVMQLTQDLKKGPDDNTWFINDDVVITFKNVGVPFKVSMVNKYYPVVDITTFYKSDDGDTIKTPPSDLMTGHIKKFEKKVEWILPIIHRDIMFSVNTRKTISMPLPYHSKEILVDDYGDDVLTTCITSHSHKMFCQNKNCEHVSANHLPKLIFPCKLLKSIL